MPVLLLPAPADCSAGPGFSEVAQPGCEQWPLLEFPVWLDAGRVQADVMESGFFYSGMKLDGNAYFFWLDISVPGERQMDSQCVMHKRGVFNGC
ncbi:hypothetical protein NTGZN8_40045 [Candidatus Nitrotoga fabula]|uniref:Uncharacterized protein n=1 Tax=Candidatus Nitrotoga fabula TaxID=2182327 RepID=A0A916BF17_9PROT|nr:hypothetical protein NTGZN8_40045 [Candidatus Nitrotoga fabula]